MLPAVGEQLLLHIPVQHAVLLLDGIHRTDLSIFLNLLDGDVADADGANLALLLQAQQQFHCRGNRCGGVLPMGLVEINDVRSQTAKALLDLMAN